ncbi:MAG: 4Fe-4S dicluster domain-containing protein [Tidjanibacter sp.]|nr:4Fe-4S dicluster domain-containing protein [Tidjanibacter sp.]
MNSQKVFDTSVQLLKYKVLKELVRRAYEGGMEEAYREIPQIISPGPKAELRCCIYKERAILQERVRMAKGGDTNNPNVIEVIDIACDECPTNAMYVTPACRGCIIHNCREVCPKDAITIVDKHAVINHEKCIECGRCVQACPYGAIIKLVRPCIQSCKVKAITIDENKKARIDNSKCILCGACLTACPFGAMADKSKLLEIIDILQSSNNNANYKVYAVVAPAIVSQCRYGRIEQVVTAIKKLGFQDVVEVALGADITLYKESREWADKQMLTSSCCPSFVRYVELAFPELKQYVSHTPSPMVEVARLIKKTEPDAKVIFIGPCASKKMEYTLEKTDGAVDSVMSFEELQAFLDARGIDTATQEDTPLNNASFYGRIFAKSGGIVQGLLNLAVTEEFKNFKPIVMNGIEECKVGLLKLKMGKAEANFFEGMACEGGCLNGPLSINRSPKNVVNVDHYGAEAHEKSIDHSVALWKMRTGEQ